MCGLTCNVLLIFDKLIALEQNLNKLFSSMHPHK